MREIKFEGQVLAIIDSVANFKPGLSFYGTAKDFIQVGAFRYDKEKVLRDHRHIPRVRQVDKTQEILIVLRGAVEVRTFLPLGNKIVDVCELTAGEFYISYHGGVGFTVRSDDTRLLEIKPGPYDVKNDDEERELL
jgi:hypothetical protein